MEIITETIAAGETKRYERAGRYFEIIDAAGRLDIELTGPSGELADDMRQALSGFYSAEKFSGFEVKNPEAYAQTVRLMITNGSGGSRRQPGIVRIVDEITDLFDTLQATLPFGTTAFTALQLVAPSANTKGLILRQVEASARAGAGGSANSSIVACQSAPSSFTSPTKQYSVIGATDSVGTATVTNGKEFNKLLPPGWGLYSLRTVTVSAALQLAYRVGYELLT